jgi:dihydroorotate dehydrogenase
MTLTDLMMPLARRLDPELAHRLAIQTLRLGLVPRPKRTVNDRILQADVFGIAFPNPIGLAAGFDKSAEVPTQLLGLGCGFVETGTLTPRQQAGNPKPRVFRLPEDQAVINRYGFNNDGLEVGLSRLRDRDRNAGIVGINVGINKDSADQAGDYAEAIRKSAGLAEYLTVNVSSPNTPGLRDLQAADQLDGLLDAVVQARDAVTKETTRPPILLKIAPDLSRKMVHEIIDIAVARRVSGVIVANTTTTRPADLKSPNSGEAGGLSGAPLFALSTQVLAWAYIASAGRIAIVGAGGVDGPETAYAKIRAGASLVQLYTALIYKGPGLFTTIIDGLGKRLRRDGYNNVANAVGVDAAEWADGSSS